MVTVGMFLNCPSSLVVLQDYLNCIYIHVLVSIWYNEMVYESTVGRLYGTMKWYGKVLLDVCRQCWTTMERCIHCVDGIFFEKSGLFTST